MNNQQINTNYISLFDAIKQRETRIASKDNRDSMKKMISAERAIKIAMKHIKNEVFLNYISMQFTETSKKGQDNYVAVKVNVKLLNFLTAIGQNDLNIIDPYSAVIIANTFANDNSLSAKGALASLSRAIEFNEFDIQDTLKNRCSVDVTTAGTQRSSTREALRIFELATVTKRKKNDTIVLTDSGIDLFKTLLKIE